MSSAAVTAPGNKNSYVSKRGAVKVPKEEKATTITKNLSKTVEKPKASPRYKYGKDETALKSKLKTKPDHEETWMGRSQKVLQSATDKLNTDFAGITHQNRQRTIPENDQYQRSEKQTINGLSMSQIDEIIKDRHKLKDENALLKNRVSELESELANVVMEFRLMFSEHEKLRIKLDTGSEHKLEPYSRVFEDRDILREAETGYKRRISRLEQEVNDYNKQFENLTEELKIMKTKFQKVKDHKVTITKLSGERSRLETELDELKTKIKTLEEHKCPNDTDIPNQENKSSDLKQTTTPRRKTLPRAPLIKVSLRRRTDVRRLDSYSDRFKHKNGLFEYEYRLPDADIADW